MKGINSAMKRYSELEVILRPNQAFLDMHSLVPSYRIKELFANMKPADLWKYAHVSFRVIEED